MPTFLHTSDWQMGMKALQAGKAASTVKDARFDTARAVIDLANERQVDFILLAGDTFDDLNVPTKVIRRTVNVLNSAEVPVYVLPGNHDPAVQRAYT